MLRGLWCGAAVLALVGGGAGLDRSAATDALGTTTAAGGATLGPPTICFPIEIGDAQSIPFGGGEHTLAKYKPYERVAGDRTRRESVKFIEDTLALLKVETPPLVRMETLRRATFYAHGMAGDTKPPGWAAERLMADVLARALNAEASQDKARRIAAWLDAAWLRGCYADLGELASTQAYDWLVPGYLLGGGAELGEYDFAASVLTMHAKALGRDSLEGYHAEHVRRAARKAEEGSLLAKNLLARFGGEGATLAKLRGP